MKNTINLFFLAISLLFVLNCRAQYYHWEWGKCNKYHTQIHHSGTEASPVATDHFGHVYACAFSSDSMIAFGSYTFVNPDTSCELGLSFLIKYDTLGNVIWAKDYKMGVFNINSVTTDRFGNIYIAGVFGTAPAIIGIDTLQDTVSGFNYFIAKLDSNGNAVWARQIDSTGYSNVSIALDNSNNLFLAGTFECPKMILGHDTLTNHHTAGSYDILLVKFDSSGNVLWARNAGGNDGTLPGAGDLCNSVATDNFGNVFITGTLQSDVAYFDTVSIANPYSHHINHTYIAKYNSLGNLLWAKAPVGVSSSTSSSAFWAEWGDISLVVATDNVGNVYMSGGFSAFQLSFGADVILNSNEGTYDVFLVKLNPVGDPLWFKDYGSYGDEVTCSISIDSMYNNIWFSGEMATRFSVFGTDTVYTPDTFAGGGYSDPIFIAKCDSAGNLKYVTALRSGGDDGNGIATDDIGNVYVCGDYSAVLFDRFIIAKDTLVNCINVGENFYLAKLTGPWYKSDTSVVDTTISDTTTLIKNNSLNDKNLLITPNPSSSQFSVAYPGQINTPTLLYMYNITGQLLNTYLMTENKITISDCNLPAGAYYIRVVIEGVNKYEKIIIYK